MAAFNTPSIPLPSTNVVPNNETVGGTLTVTGATMLSSTVTTGALTVAGNETVSGTLGVTGAVLFSSNLGVSGTLGANGATNLFSTLNVTGATALASTLGVTGVTTVADGSAAAPSVVSATGTSDTGLFFPAADTVAVSTAGSERLRIGSTGNVGIGTASPSTKFAVSSGVNAGIAVTDGTVNTVIYSSTGGNSSIGTTSNHPVQLYANNAARVTIDTSGNVLIGTTSTNPISSRTNGMAILSTGFTTIRAGANMALGIDSTSGGHINFYTDNGSAYVAAGNITSSGSTTAYNITSDYRLKQNVHPMLNALDRVSRLKPCTFEFIEGNQRSEGFIAHELQDVIPYAVTGEKDAIDDKGNPKHQSLDPSFIVATLTAAIQEQHALILGLMAKVEALEARG